MKTGIVIVSVSLLASAGAPAAFGFGDPDDPTTRSSTATYEVNPSANQNSNSAPAAKTLQGGGGGGGGGRGSSATRGFNQNNGGGGANSGAVSSEEIMRQVKQAIDMAMQSAGAAIEGASRATKDADQSQMWSQWWPKFDAFQGNRQLQAWPGQPQRLHGGGHEAAAVVVTRPMDHKDSAELQEDLRVMDQLLRDQVARIADKSANEVLGIQVVRASRSSAPMYLEDCGAVFSYRASFPLTRAQEAASKSGEKPDQQGQSAWDRAKAEVDSPEAVETRAEAPHGNSQRLQSQLINSIIEVLPEAKHIRNLKETDWVVVTVAGSDENGSPARLTLKAKKGDIDRVATGAGDQLKPEEFKARVEWTIN